MYCYLVHDKGINDGSQSMVCQSDLAFVVVNRSQVPRVIILTGTAEKSDTFEEIRGILILHRGNELFGWTRLKITLVTDNSTSFHPTAVEPEQSDTWQESQIHCSETIMPHYLNQVSGAKSKHHSYFETLPMCLCGFCIGYVFKGILQNSLRTICL